MGLSLSQPSLKYGHFAEYQCRYSINNCNGNLEMYINGSHRLSSLNSTLDPRDYDYHTECENNHTEFVLKFWILINDKTLNSVMNITCEYSLHHDHPTYMDNVTTDRVVRSINRDDIIYPCEECHKNNIVTTSKYNTYTADKSFDITTSKAPINGCLKRTILLSIFLTALILLLINN
jgi:uncharacterized protein (UPF0297 family)